MPCHQSGWESLLPFRSILRAPITVSAPNLEVCIKNSFGVHSLQC